RAVRPRRRRAGGVRGGVPAAGTGRGGGRLGQPPGLRPEGYERTLGPEEAVPVVPRRRQVRRLEPGERNAGGGASAHGLEGSTPRGSHAAAVSHDPPGR